MSGSRSSVLRRRITGGGGPLVLPGVPNALTARVLEDVGFEAVYVSGAGVSNSFLGAPDIGLLTLSEMCAHVSAICDAVQLPVVVDADTGYGNALNLRRAVRALEHAGASAIQIEDQVTPKRCGHFDGKAVISAAEMLGKVHAALDIRDDPELLIIARTDARATLGLEEACDRARRYLDAGADLVFVEAPETREELAAIPAAVPGHHVANMVEGGLTPTVALKELADLGYSVVLYANTLMRAAMASMRLAATQLLHDGDSLALGADLVSWADRQQLVQKPMYDSLAELYGGSDE